MPTTFKVRVGLCNQCPPNSDTQPVAVYGNGLQLCEAHDNGVRENHQLAYKRHPLLRDQDEDGD